MSIFAFKRSALQYAILRYNTRVWLSATALRATAFVTNKHYPRLHVIMRLPVCVLNCFIHLYIFIYIYIYISNIKARGRHYQHNPLIMKQIETVIYTDEGQCSQEESSLPVCQYMLRASFIIFVNIFQIKNLWAGPKCTERGEERIRNFD